MSFQNIKYGIYGGLAGGLVFGGLMGMMGTLPMIGQMVGVPSAAAGFFVHMVISAIIGGSFPVLLAWGVPSWRGGVGAGSVYGLMWWFVGPLTLMPLFMGMGLGVNWSGNAMVQAAPSLLGHLLFGAILGFTYRWLREHASWRGVTVGQAKGV